MHTCIYACTHAYMRICAERCIFLTDAVASTGTVEHYVVLDFLFLGIPRGRIVNQP